MRVATTLISFFFNCCIGNLGWSAFAARENVQIAISAPPSNLNPFFSTDSNSQNIGRLVYLSLIDFDAEMRVKCRLCESFVESNKQGKHQFTFHLKKGVHFWDGQEISAQDVASSIRLFQSENDSIKSIFRFAFGKIKRVKVIDNYKISLEYEKFALDNLPNLVLLKIIKLKKNFHEYSEKKHKIELHDIVGVWAISFW